MGVKTKLIKVRYPDKHNRVLVHAWLKENAKGEWYNGKDWDNWEVGEENRMVQFAQESDAVLFALRWS